MQRIHERVWIYCGHESQVPKTGDYYPSRSAASRW
jgi:phenylpropionate dioxygenase-like ring-hydroxylating dioxygenase large terminal subunit